MPAAALSIAAGRALFQLLTILRYDCGGLIDFGRRQMKHLATALVLTAAVAALPAAGRADEARCASAWDGESASIGCAAVNEAMGNQLADLLSRILNDRLDPQMVMVKLGEIEPLPPEGVARAVADDQRQAIVNSLAGKQTQQIAIIAHPQVFDSAEYAGSLATPLLMAGWQVEGNQVRRAAPKQLDGVYGVALVVRDPNAPPEKTAVLRRALSAAKIPTPLVTDPALAPDATVLWIGKRPSFAIRK